jgi:hypothetical protein
MNAIFPEALKQKYDLPILNRDINKPAKIALDLFLKNPAVDLRHITCAGQLVWSINSSCRDRTNIDSDQDELEKGSIFFGRLSKHFPVITTRFNHNLNLIMAVYMYCAIYCTSIFTIRTRNWRYLLFLTPIVIQSAVLLLINISQAYRYQYGVALVGMLALGLLLVPMNSKTPIKNETIDTY